MTEPVKEFDAAKIGKDLWSRMSQRSLSSSEKRELLIAEFATQLQRAYDLGVASQRERNPLDHACYCRECIELRAAAHRARKEQPNE
jgi:hypothetical protein